MSERFGDMLRRIRRKADKTLGDVARELGVSVPYISDVERGNRKPFTTERLIQLARFLNSDGKLLIDAADKERGIIEYDIRRASPLQADVVGGLVAGLARGGVSDEQLEDIREILNGQGAKKADE
jgi:transcriptional regulator with XRE-family HTH domain